MASRYPQYDKIQHIQYRLSKLRYSALRQIELRHIKADKATTKALDILDTNTNRTLNQHLAHTYLFEALLTAREYEGWNPTARKLLTKARDFLQSDFSRYKVPQRDLRALEHCEKALKFLERRPRKRSAVDKMLDKLNKRSRASERDPSKDHSRGR